MSNFMPFGHPSCKEWKHRETAKTNFGEPSMVKYLRKHVLDAEFDVLSANWMSGLGSVPLGLTTYAPNCIERSHIGHTMGYRANVLGTVTLQL